ncbi:MAG: DsbA family oxidoreductase [Bacteroidota bacterium]|nr:DsbA family oxidoreductase [Bacteroidota bacterium]
MKIEIWSDVMCPFCYIGKRKFEKALSEFEGKEKVQVEWKSFQLNPDMKTDISKNVNQHLSETKGISLEQAKEMTSRVTEIAKEVGLNYNFDKAIVANSFDAHRLIQFAKRKELGDQMEEALFKAYFIDGKNTADHSTLLSLAVETGLEETETKAILESGIFADEVEADIELAGQIGVRGVPFFVFDRKYAVSGAQAPEVFLETMKKAME